MQFNLDMMVPYKDLVLDAVRDVVESRQYIFGPKLAKFEEEFALYCEQAHCVGVGSGTDALRIALLALGVGPGDEVISPAFNVAYTALAVAAVGAKNVFVDCVPDTMLMDPDKIGELVTPDTKAIIPVHLFGQMNDMVRIAAVAAKYGLVVVEDAAQCHGATSFSFTAGRFSHAVAYSFYPTKNLGALGEGGAVTTNIPIVAKRARLLRDGGRTDRYLHNLVGVNSGLDEIQAAVLLTKLPFLDSRNKQRRVAAARYDALSVIDEVRLPKCYFGNEHVYHLYVIRTYAHDRGDLRGYLASKGIPSLVHYPVPVPYQPCFVGGLFPGPWPEAEKAAREVLSLPMHADITPEEQDEVIAAVKGFYGRT